MPELPEVEIIRQGLSSKLTYQSIENIWVHDPRVIKKISQTEFIKKLLKYTFKKIERKGKFLIFVFYITNKPEHPCC